MFTLHVAPTATVPHVVEAVKLLDGVTLDTISGAVPQSVTTTGCVPEVVPTGWLPNATLARLRHTAGVVAIP